MIRAACLPFTAISLRVQRRPVKYLNTYTRPQPLAVEVLFAHSPRWNDEGRDGKWCERGAIGGGRRAGCMQIRVGGVEEACLYMAKGDGTTRQAIQPQRQFIEFCYYRPASNADKGLIIGARMWSISPSIISCVSLNFVP